MATPRIGILPSADRMAIFDAARRLKLDPYELGGFLSLESGPNMDPNIRGGAGGNYYGMIQFGPSEQQKYLDQSRMGKYTRAEQMPKAVQFLLDRGFKPGQMGIDRAYATVLGGNPNVSLQAKDSFGTSVAGALPRFRKGGDLYENARRVLGDIPNVAPRGIATTLEPQPQPQQQPRLAGDRDPMLMQLAQQMVQPILAPLLQPPKSSSLSFGDFLNMVGTLGQ